MFQTDKISNMFSLLFFFGYAPKQLILQFKCFGQVKFWDIFLFLCFLEMYILMIGFCL